MKLMKTTYILPILLSVFISSCVRDEIPDCPPLRVNIAVKDKNYFNVDKVELEERLSDDLPFREYVPTLYWVLRDLNTGDIVDESPLITVSGDERTVTPDICPCVPHGKYVLTVWGGLDSRDALDEEMTTLTFHPGNTEGKDVYMTNDTLLYDAWHNDYTVELERTKGKLIIEKVNLPSDISSSEKTVTGLFGEVNSVFRYGGETSVTRRSEFVPAPQVVTKTVLAPSLKEDGSRLSLNFTDNAAKSSPLIPKTVNITMRRNELTVLRYVWDGEKRDFTIYILVNDNWEVVHNMGLE